MIMSIDNDAVVPLIHSENFGSKLAKFAFLLQHTFVFFFQKSTVLVEEMIQDLKSSMLALPLHASTFMNMICAVLRNYKDTCWTAYNSEGIFAILM